MSNATKFTKSLTSIITYLLFAVLILALLSGIMYLISSPTGIYVVYAEENITSENSGITIEWSDEQTEVTFTIQNSGDWGAYSVQDCTVKVIPNIASKNDFEFTADGATSLFSAESDLTAAFVADYTTYSGNGFEINSDGEFTLYLLPFTSDYLTSAMVNILSRANGGVEVVIDSEIDLLNNIYFALEVTSPDESTTFTVPFNLYVNAYFVTYDLDCVTSDSVNPVVLTGGESSVLQFTVADNYIFPEEITVTGATLDSWDSATGTAVISNVTGNVNIVIEALRLYSITCNLSNVTASADNVTTIAENDSVDLYFYADAGYTLPQSITVTGVSYYSPFFTTSLCLSLYNPTSNVTVTIEGVEDSTSTYTLSGEYTFGDTFYSGEDFSSGIYNCSFTCNGESYSYMIVMWGLNCVQIAYGTTTVCTQTSGWVDSSYCTIDFGEEQTVSEALYKFITTYATSASAVTLYTVYFKASQYQYFSSVSPLAEDNIIGYMSSDDTLTVEITADDSVCIYYVFAENATIDSQSVSNTEYELGNTITFTISNPTDDVMITLYFAS